MLQNYLRSILSSSMGNVIEWYDFGLFSIFAGLFSQIFFPASDHTAALISTSIVFAIGFLCRPVGAILFGYLGDTIGRAKTLRFSVLMIAIPTLLVGFLPTYDEVGLIAPFLLLLIRMLQGICVGGEYSGNLVYLAESAPERYRATCTSFASVGANFGILLAALVGLIMTHFLSDQALLNWGWRFAYMISGVICLLLYVYRLRLKETRAFKQYVSNTPFTTNPIKQIFRSHRHDLLRTFGMVCMGTTFYYFCFVFLPIYITRYHAVSTSMMSYTLTLFIGLMMVMVPFAGYLCDQVGRRKLFLFNAVFITVSAVPGFYYLQSDVVYFLFPVLLLFTIASSLEQGTTSVTVVENFPMGARYTGVSLGYNLGNGILGGTVPMVSEWLLSHTAIPLSPAYYVSFCAVITGLVVYFFVPETRESAGDLISVDPK